MKSRELILAGCMAILLTSCASQASIRTPLPPGITNPRPPQAGLAQPVAAYVGVWAGRWDGVNFQFGLGSSGVEQTMVIQRIVAIDEHTYQASVIVSWGEAPEPPREPGFFRTTGVIGADGVLRIKPFPNGGRHTATLSQDQRRLRIEYRGGLTLSGLPISLEGTLWRTTLP